jgi:hypothetical protein
VFILKDREAFAKMMKRSSISRASVDEFRESTSEESFAFLKSQIWEAKFDEKKVALENFVENYTGGNFNYLNTVVDDIDDLKGLNDRCFIVSD